MVAINVVSGALIAGVLLGIFYGLIALGFSMVWASMKLPNVAHAALMLTASYGVVTLIQHYGLGWTLSSFIVICLMFMLGAALYYGILRHAYRTEEFETVALVATFGITIALENALSWFFGTSYTSVDVFLSGLTVIAGIRIHHLQVIAALLAIGSSVGLYFLIYKSSIGRSVRAAWQDQEVAMMYGVNPDNVRIFMFGTATLLAGVAGVILPALRPITPAVHWEYIVLTFIIVIIGSVGSISGTILVGTGVGIIRETLPLLMPSSWTIVILYIILLGFLLYRPSGLFRGWA
ncbi:MAG: branched-chain amino acid ABC transporter permease [Halobacteriaceae archaeon]